MALNPHDRVLIPRFFFIETCSTDYYFHIGINLPVQLESRCNYVSIALLSLDVFSDFIVIFLI
jgi:hypothetical protein